MTRAEIMKKIDEIENRRFFLAMKDFWDWRDRDTDRMLEMELNELKAMLEN